MQKIQGNWRIRQVKKIDAMKRVVQSIVSFVLSINLILVLPPIEASAQVAIEMEEPIVRRKPTMDEWYDVIAQERRTPERVESVINTLLANTSNTRNKFIVPFLQETMVVEEPQPRYIPTEEEYQLLCQLVEAEVTGYDVWRKKGLSHEEIINAKVRVAQVFLNRVESDRFPYDTLKGCILEPSATSTILDGRFYQVRVTEYTKEAVAMALSPYTPDMTKAALFFSSGPGEPYGGGTMFTDEVGHKFAR